MVDMDTDQLLANSLDQQGGNNAGVNTAGQCQQHFLVANLRTNFSNLFLNELLCQCGIGDTLHGFGTYICRHSSVPSNLI